MYSSNNKRHIYLCIGWYIFKNSTRLEYSNKGPIGMKYFVEMIIIMREVLSQGCLQHVYNNDWYIILFENKMKYDTFHAWFSTHHYIY